MILVPQYQPTWHCVGQPQNLNPIPLVIWAFPVAAAISGLEVRFGACRDLGSRGPGVCYHKGPSTKTLGFWGPKALLFGHLDP